MLDQDVSRTRIRRGKPKVSRKTAKRLGIGLFLFFLIKGLAWLTLPLAAGAYVFLKGCAG